MNTAFAHPNGDDPYELCIEDRISLIPPPRIWSLMKTGPSMHIFGVWLGDRVPNRKYSCKWPGGGVIHDESILIYGIPWLKDNRYFNEAYEAGSWVAASDVMRLALLYEFGGIYLDTDVEVINSQALGRLYLDNPNLLIAGREDAQWIGSAILMATPRHPVIGTLLNKYKYDIRFEDTYAKNGVTGPTILTQHIAGKPDVKILPTEVFYPFHWSEKAMSLERKFAKLTPNTVAIHHWDFSWGTPEMSTDLHTG